MIVVGVDHSAGAKEALRLALEEARLRQATLCAVHAIGASDPVLGEELVYPVAGNEIEELRSAAQAGLDALVDEIASDADGAQIDRRVVEAARLGSRRRISRRRTSGGGIARAGRLRGPPARLGQPAMCAPRGLPSRDGAQAEAVGQ